MSYSPNSSVVGFLGGASTIPTDQELEDLINPTLAGITGLDKNKQIRPRFSVDPPTVPDRSVNWVAFGINRVVSPSQASVFQKDANSAVVIRYQEIELLLSWYGPKASHYAELFRDGILIGQNRDLLAASDLGVVDVGEARKVPELFKEKYLTRYDMLWTLRRRTERTYSVKDLASVNITLNTDPVGETPTVINVNP